MKKQELRVAGVINSLTTGGAEREFALITNHLARRHKVKAFLLEGDRDLRLDARVRVKVLSRVSRHSSFARRLLNVFSGRRRLTRALEPFQPSIVYSFLEPANSTTVRVARQLQYPTITFISTFVSNTYGRGLYGAYFRARIKRWYRQANLVVVNAQRMALDLQENFGVPQERIRVVYNPVDIKSVQRRAQEPLSRALQQRFKRGPVVVTVGRLTHLKGQWHLIRAFQKVLKRVPKAQLCFVGDGELRSELEWLVRELGLEANVFFVGNQENPFPYVKAATLFALSSVGEGFPYALIEALACGTPVVSTDCLSGPRELLAPTTDIKRVATRVERAAYGVLVPPVSHARLTVETLTRAEASLAKALTMLLTDKKLHRGYARHGLERCKDFNTSVQLARIKSLFAEVIQQRRL